MLAVLLACDTSPRVGARLGGHAVFRGLDNHQGIEIELVDDDLGDRTVTDAFGYFAFEDVPPGSYKLVARSESTMEKAVVRSVAHTEAATSTLITLSPLGRIVGRVLTTINRAPVVGASVNVLGSDAQADTVEQGTFTLESVPAGRVVVMATGRSFQAATVEVQLTPGETATVELRLEPDLNRDPYDLNNPPTLSPIQLTATVDSAWPRPLPLVDTTGGQVRRGSLYRLEVEARDPDGDPVQVFWNVDRGALLESQGPVAQWSAGPATSTIVCTAIDSLGRSSTVRRVVNATGDNMRGAGRFGETVFYSERRGSTYQVYRYQLQTGVETAVTEGSLEHHGATVVGDWLVYGHSEFVFIGTLAYRLRARNLVDGRTRTFGQTFGNDSTFVSRFDLYSPLGTPLVPFLSSDASVVPTGYGFFDIARDQPADLTSPFTPGPGPANLQAFAREGSRDVWFDGNTLWQRRSGGAAEQIADFPARGGPVDLQLNGGIVAVLLDSKEPVRWVHLDSAEPEVREAGVAVSSFALHQGRLAVVEEGPSAASVQLIDLDTGASRVLTPAPRVARRLWFLDDTYVVWGDQGIQGQSFVPLNSELLWIAPVQ